MPFADLVGHNTLVEKIVFGVFAIIFFGAFVLAVSVDLRGKPGWCIAPVVRQRVVTRRPRTEEREQSKRRESEGWLDPESQEWVDQRWREPRR